MIVRESALLQSSAVAHAAERRPRRGIAVAAVIASTARAMSAVSHDPPTMRAAPGCRRAAAADLSNDHVLSDDRADPHRLPPTWKPAAPTRPPTSSPQETALAPRQRA